MCQIHAWIISDQIELGLSSSARVASSSAAPQSPNPSNGNQHPGEKRVRVGVGRVERDRTSRLIEPLRQHLVRGVGPVVDDFPD